MNSEDKYIIKEKELERYFDHHKALFEFSKLFKYDDGDDRTIVIVGAAFLDNILEHILRNFLPEDEKEVETLLAFEQPLGTYGNKVRMTYCLGLIDKVIKDDLKLVGKIRNRFAHDLNATFEDQQIKSWCEQLAWHRISMFREPPHDATTRDFFQVGVHQLITNMNGMIGLARTDKRSIRNDFDNERK